MMVNGRKHVVKVKIKVETEIVVIAWSMTLFVYLRHYCYEGLQSHNITRSKNQQIIIKKVERFNGILLHSVC